MKKIEIAEKKRKIITAFDESKTKAITDICRIANVPREDFYYYLRQDRDFKKACLSKQQANLVQQIATI